MNAYGGSFSLENLPLAELADFRDMVFTLPPEASPLYAMIRDIFREEHFEPKVAVTTPNVLIPEAMIRSGRRVGLLPSHHLKADPKIRYFRIRNTRKLTIAYLSQKGHEYSEMERYLIWLFRENEGKKPGHRMAESEALQDIMREFDPAGVYGRESWNADHEFSMGGAENANKSTGIYHRHRG